MKKAMLLFLCFFAVFSSIGLSQLPVLTEKEKADGWQLLFDGKSSTGWKSARGDKFPEKGWEIKDGILAVLAKQRGGDIVTTDQYANFELALEFKLTPGANSGIKYDVQPNTGLGLEYQILDDEQHPDANQGVAGNRTVGSLYDLIPAENKIVKPMGEWNQALLIVNGNEVENWLNGNKAQARGLLQPLSGNAEPQEAESARKERAVSEVQPGVRALDYEIGHTAILSSLRQRRRWRRSRCVEGCGGGFFRR